MIRSNKVRRQDSLRMCARFGTRQKKLDLVHHQIKSIYTHSQRKKIKVDEKDIENRTKSKVAVFVRFYIVTVLKYQVKRRFQDVRYI